MTTIDVSLSDDLHSYAQQQASRGGFATLGDYVQALIAEAQRRDVARSSLEAMLVEGLNSPVRELTSDDWSSLRERIYQKNPELRNPRGIERRDEAATNPHS
jgi:Arc/MetJ-type ribon-helix-helix transcriptional regulator